MPNPEMNDGLDGVDREMEEALSALAPASVSAAARDEMMFAAGARAAKRSVWAWRGVAALFAVGAGLSIVLRPGPMPPRVVSVPAGVQVQRVVALPLGKTTGPYTAASLTAIGIESGVETLPVVGGGRRPSSPRAIPSLRGDQNLN